MDRAHDHDHEFGNHGHKDAHDDESSEEDEHDHDHDDDDDAGSRLIAKNVGLNAHFILVLLLFVIFKASKIYFSGD